MSPDAIEFGIIIVGALAILGVIIELCRLTLDGDERIANAANISRRSMRNLCNRVDAERAADPNRQS